METSDMGHHIRLPWQSANPPMTRPTATRLNSRRPRPDMPPRRPSMAQSFEARRVQFLDWLPLRAKNHVVAVLSEFAGTFMFLLFALGGTNAVNSAPLAGRSDNLAADPARLLFISLCFGMSLAVNAWTFFRISGGLFNPAVTIGMMTIGAMGYVRGVLIMISQLAGAIAASAVILGLESKGEINVLTTLSDETSPAQGLFIEMFLTAQLVFTIFMLAAEKHRGTFIAPVGIGLSLFIAELMGVYYTGGSLNPARTFGPCAVMGTFDSNHWVYWVGPILGALLASLFYVAIKALEYETVNPQQDYAGDADRFQLGPVAEAKKSHEESGQFEDSGMGRPRVLRTASGVVISAGLGTGRHGSHTPARGGGGGGGYFGPSDLEAAKVREDKNELQRSDSGFA